MSAANNKSIQDKLSDLSSLVDWFQSDAFSLEEALDKYKTAKALADEIETDLDTLKNDIVVVKKKFDSES